MRKQTQGIRGSILKGEDQTTNAVAAVHHRHSSFHPLGSSSLNARIVGAYHAWQWLDMTDIIDRPSRSRNFLLLPHLEYCHDLFLSLDRLIDN